MYNYKVEEMLACFAEHGYPYEGTPPSEQAYIDSEGGWSPYGGNMAYSAYELLSEKCPQTPVEYWNQPFW